MNRYRSHFRRVIPGTSQVEHMQVLTAPAMEGPQDGVVVDTWVHSGKGVRHTRTHVEDVQPEDARDEHEDSIREMLGDGWEHCFHAALSDVPAPDAEALLIKFEADADLMPHFEEIASRTTEVGRAIERESLVYLGSHGIELSRKRRKAGETRDLRYDTVNAKVPRDSLAAQLLAMLCIHYGGQFMDFTGTPVDPRTYAVTLNTRPELQPLLEHFGINLPWIAPGRLLRPWGQPVQPAVF